MIEKEQINGIKNNIIITVLSTLISTAIISALGYLVAIPWLISGVHDLEEKTKNLQVIEAKVNDQGDQLTKLSGQNDNLKLVIQNIADVFNYKFHIKLLEFSSIVSQRNLPSEQVKSTLNLIINNPKQAKLYLIKNLHFTDEQVKAVLDTKN